MNEKRYKLAQKLYTISVWLMFGAFVALAMWGVFFK